MKSKSSLPTSTILALALLVLGGCSSEEPVGPGQHDAPELAEQAGARVVVRTDLAPAQAKIAADRGDKLEALLDRRFPWLKPSDGRVRIILLDDEGRFRALARAHDVPAGGATAFACKAGEVIVRFKPEEWGQGPDETDGSEAQEARSASRRGEPSDRQGGSWVQAPRSAPVAEVLFRQRLEATYGSGLDRTWLEDGCARLFSEEAARELGETREAARRTRDDLLAAFLPLFLGGDPVLAKTALARGSAAESHQSERSQRPARERATAYAVTKFLLDADSGKRAGFVREGLEAAAGLPGAEQTFGARTSELQEAEDAFERWLRGQTTDALLDALRDEPVLAARWEARGALRLVAAVDVALDDTSSPAVRAEVVGRARNEVATRKTVRFAEEFDEALADLGAHHRPGGLERLVVQARAQLDERAKGYGHPALEEGRAQLGKTLEARMKQLAGR